MAPDHGGVLSTALRVKGVRSKKVCPKQGVCPAPTSSHTITAHRRMGMNSLLSTLHLVSHTDALYTRSPLRVPTRAGGPYRKHAPLQRTARPSDALPAAVRPRLLLSCTLWLATIRSRRRRSSLYKATPHGSWCAMPRPSGRRWAPPQPPDHALRPA